MGQKNYQKERKNCDMQGYKVERNLSKKGLFAGCPFLSTVYWAVSWASHDMQGYKNDY